MADRGPGDRVDVPPQSLADAEEVGGAALRRIEADERAADAMRERIEREGLPVVPVDALPERVIRRLRAREEVVQIRRGVVLDRIDEQGQRVTHIGRLYLTTARLLLEGRPALATDLADIAEISVAGERMLVTLTAGGGLSIDVQRPRELRVAIAAVISRLR